MSEIPHKHPWSLTALQQAFQFYNRYLQKLGIPARVVAGGSPLLSDEAMYLISPYPHIYIQFPRTKVAGAPAIAVPRSLTDPFSPGMVQLRPPTIYVYFFELQSRPIVYH